MRVFYKYLVVKNILSTDPCEKVETPKIMKSIPKTLDEKEVEKLLDCPNINSPLGLRDKIYSADVLQETTVTLHLKSEKYLKIFFFIP